MANETSTNKLARRLVPTEGGNPPEGALGHGLSQLPQTDDCWAAGFKFGKNGPHSSRTMMLAELGVLLDRMPAGAVNADFRRAVVQENLLNKKTEATRRESFRRLRELYGLDLGIKVFDVLRAYWAQDRDGRPLLALLVALVRDPLLRISASVILTTPAGAEVRVEQFSDALLRALPGHLGQRTRLTTARNTASTWEQSGHLLGHLRKTRALVRPTPWAVTLALFLAYLSGERGEYLLSSDWLRVLDVQAGEASGQVGAAHRLGLLNFFRSGAVVQITFPELLKPAGD